MDNKDLKEEGSPPQKEDIETTPEARQEDTKPTLIPILEQAQIHSDGQLEDSVEESDHERTR